MIVIPTGGAEDWRRFLAAEHHWRPGYSAWETAHSWEGARALPPEVAALLPEATELLLALPEYKVALPGRGAESQNDVFALLAGPDGTTACMIEGKRDEPFGPTLKTWRAKASPGKEARLAAICDLLGLDAAALPQALRYQLLHRTASAVLTARRFHCAGAAMIVQSFSPEHRWFADFEAFAALFGGTVRPGRAFTTPLADGMPLTLGWAPAPLSAKET